VTDNNFNSDTLDTGDEQDQAATTLSLLGGVGGADAMDAVGVEAGVRQDKSKMQHLMAVGVVALVGVAVLAGMRLTQGGIQTTDAATTQAMAEVETRIAQLTTPGAVKPGDPISPEGVRDLFEDTAHVVAVFSANQTEHQVPLEQVQKDPFELQITRAQEAAPDNSAIAERQRAERLRRLESELVRLNLQSIAGANGGRAVAVIDNEFFRVGSQLGSFTITAIEPLRVELAAEGTSFELVID
jgi:hypothetical protein